MPDYKPTSPSSTLPETKAPGSAGSMDMLLLTYLLLAAGLIVPFVAFAAAILAYVSRGGVAGTWRESHYTWLIRTFWIGLAAGIVASIANYLLLVVVAVWAAIRLFRGWSAYTRQQEVEQPEDWLFG